MAVIEHLWSQVANTRPPPGFILPTTWFLPGHSAQLLAPVKEELYLYSPKSTFGPLKATLRLMWPLMKMSLTPLPSVLSTLKVTHAMGC